MGVAESVGRRKTAHTLGRFTKSKGGAKVCPFSDTELARAWERGYDGKTHELVPGMIQDTIPDDRAQAEQERQRLEADVRAAKVKLDTFPKGLMNPTPDAVKTSPEWRMAKQESDRAFARLQAFNVEFVRKFRRK